MRILHTSDWHLGHRLYDRERREEQQMALQWLLNTIEQEQIDLLLVAGDIFDVANPPNYARQQYYDFLAQLRGSGCRHVVIVGGNHDSPAMLNAPAAIFRHFDIHIVGSAKAQLEDQIIQLKNSKGELEAVVAAVPFLRDRDLHYSQAGESAAARERRLQQGIRQHYEGLANAMATYQKMSVPILTTGHLYAHGASAEEKRSNIYIGNRSNIAGSDFPKLFNYVALGHIHRPQKVAELNHVRYSGSLIPLDFSEMVDNKGVFVLDFTGAKLDTISQVPVPLFRRLKQLAGSLEEVKNSLERFLARRSTTEFQEPLAPWIEVRIQADQPILLPREQLEEIIENRPAELLAVKLERSTTNLPHRPELTPDLTSLTVEEVFERRCRDNEEELPAEYDELLNSFRTLRNWHAEKEVV
ncbi:MAG: exonuclease SbcCD subunit D C-terminal domain-containing protein [Bacteroidota bacterium]